MTAISVFHYQDNKISFRNSDGSIMVNATHMARFFGKKPVDWLKTQQSKDFLEELPKVKMFTLVDLVKVTKGGSNPGTWMHEDVALEFARWLSPAFGIWCNDRVKELLMTGVSVVRNDDQAILYAIDVLKRRVEESNSWCIVLQEDNRQKDIVIHKLTPQADYYREVLSSDSVYLTDQIAKELGMTAIRLNKILKSADVLMKRGGQWVLRSKYASEGYTKTKTYSYQRKDETTGTNCITVWTEKGRAFIHRLKKEGKLNL